MSIEEPKTYGEFWFKSQLDQQEAFEEKLEESLQDFIPNIFRDSEIRAAMPFDVLPKLEGLLAFPHPGLAAVGGRFVSEVADQAVSMVMTPALRKTQYAANRLFANLKLSPDQATALFRRKRLAAGDFEYDMSIAGFDEFERKLAYDASSPFPTVPELLRWARYHGPPDNTWSTLFKYVDLDPIDYPKFEWLSHLQLSTDQLTALYRRGNRDLAQTQLGLQQVGWYNKDVGEILDLSYNIPNPMLLLQSGLHRGDSIDSIFKQFRAADLHPAYHQSYYDAVLTKPGSGDLVAYHHRQENDLRGLEDDLRRIGIHPDYTDVYRTLAYQIPPINDIITMAVREVFNPAVARRFGQFEDFPKDFGRYAEMQGLTREWAERYWAAHWTLPSATQGFEMLHRGIIDEDDLDLLLRSLDYMPFWREKLQQVSYRPLTRVDVRRMYAEGVLDEKAVYQAYLDIGYNEDNAESMTEFTLAYVLKQQTRFTTQDVVKAYVDRMIDRGEARDLLRELGVDRNTIDTILDSAEYKREWALTESKQRGIRNLYKRGTYDENQARSQLLRLDLPSDQVDALMEQWYYERAEEEPKTWTRAETLKFMKSGTITMERGVRELKLLGYDDEHIDVYLEGLDT